MSNLVHNEQMRLVANLFNNLAVVSVATGFIAPLFSIHPRGTLIGFSAIGLPTFGAITGDVLFSIFVGLVFCVIFELIAHSYLMKLKE